MKETETLHIETESNNSGKKKGGLLHIIYIVIILALLGGAGYLYTELDSTHSELAQLKDDIIQVNTEKQALYTQLDSLEQEIIMHMGENEKLDSLLLIKQQEIKQIRRILASQKADIAQIDKYKKQVEILRKTADQYIQENAYLKYQVDSLEHVSTYKQSRIDTMEIVDFQKTQKIEELNSKVEEGSQIRVSDMSVEPYNKRGKIMTRAKRVTSFKVTGTMLKNVLATAGKKTIYIRITGPNGIVFSSDPGNQFEYEGKTIMYTEKREISYNNNDVPFEVFYDAENDKLDTGSYKVVVFCEGKEIGKANLELR